MIRVCAHCWEVIGFDIKISMEYPTHGACLKCLPGWLRECDIPEDVVHEITKKEERRQNANTT